MLFDIFCLCHYSGDLAARPLTSSTHRTRDPSSKISSKHGRHSLDAGLSTGSGEYIAWSEVNMGHWAGQIKIFTYWDQKVIQNLNRSTNLFPNFWHSKTKQNKIKKKKNRLT